jgi:uncharacterized membrane protein YoaT (DUF817 family)
MDISSDIALPIERRLSRIIGAWAAHGFYDFLVFGLKEAAACVFAGSFLFLLAVSGHVSIPGLSRYDFLFLSAILIQILQIMELSREGVFPRWNRSAL